MADMRLRCPEPPPGHAAALRLLAGLPGANCETRADALTPPIQYLLGQLTVRAGAVARRIEPGYRLSSHGSVRESHRPADDGVEDEVAESLHDAGQHFPGVQGTESYMVASRPSMASFGLSREDTLSMVSISSATPRRAKNSHSSGTSTPSAQARALTVSKPSDGWQSIRMTS